MKTVKPMNKSFIAKLLVLCMIVSLLPTMALAATETSGTDDDTYYTVKLDTAPVHGSVKVSYGTYTITPDTNGTDKVKAGTKETITLEPDDGYVVDNDTSWYTINGGTHQAITSEPVTVDGNLVIHAEFTQTTTPPSTGGSTTTTDTVTDVSDATTGDESSVVEIDANARVSNGVATASVNNSHLNEAVNKALAAAEKNDTAPEIDIVVDTKDAKGLKLTLGTDAMTSWPRIPPLS